MSALHLSDLLRRDVASDPIITGVTADSRKVAPGALFVALPGTTAGGRGLAGMHAAARVHARTPTQTVRHPSCLSGVSGRSRDFLRTRADLRRPRRAPG